MPTVQFKVVFIGNENVGKSSLVRRFIDDQFSENYISTLGFQMFYKAMDIDDYSVGFEIWDLAGQQSFDFARKNYCAQSHGFFLVFDLAEPSSFQDLDKWFAEIQGICPNKPFILLGNKADLPNSKINKGEFTKKGKQLGAAGRMLTSAKTGSNVKDAFELLGRTILKSLKIDVTPA